MALHSEDRGIDPKQTARTRRNAGYEPLRRRQSRYQIDLVMASATVKQLLLRVPDEVHRRLTARAARDRRSVNSVATEILDAAADADEGDRRERLRARAATLGILRAMPATPGSEAKRRRVIASTRGIGPVLDQLLAEERERA